LTAIDHGFRSVLDNRSGDVRSRVMYNEHIPRAKKGKKKRKKNARETDDEVAFTRVFHALSFGRVSDYRHVLSRKYRNRSPDKESFRTDPFPSPTLYPRGACCAVAGVFWWTAFRPIPLTTFSAIPRFHRAADLPPGFRLVPTSINLGIELPRRRN